MVDKTLAPNGYEVKRNAIAGKIQAKISQLNLDIVNAKANNQTAKAAKLEALRNSLQAFKDGATWIDGTIQGMGRGAGNAKTESLLKYFSKFNYYPNSINNVSKNYFYIIWYNVFKIR